MTPGHYAQLASQSNLSQVAKFRVDPHDILHCPPTKPLTRQLKSLASSTLNVRSHIADAAPNRGKQPLSVASKQTLTSRNVRF